jgi:hypothetical protein
MKKSRYDLLILLKNLKKNKLTSSLGALTTEKRKLEKISSHLNEMLTSSDFSKGQIVSSSSIKQVSRFRKNIQEKIEISNNRKAHLLYEISDYLKQIHKTSKQKEIINSKKQQMIAIQKDIEESKNEFNFKTKIY